MKKLEDLLNIADIDTGNVNETFQEIAETLMWNYIIKKGNKRYAIVEIEFYLYTRNHKDFITYPRDLKAGRWFFHPSGVDITFESKDITIESNDSGNEVVILKENPLFGGILIRGIYKLPYIDDNGKEHSPKYVFGPHKCVDELWDNFSIFKSCQDEYPIITEASKEDIKKKKDLVPYKRHIKIDKKRYNNPKSKVEEWAKRLGLEVSDNNLKKEIEDYSDKLFGTNAKFYDYRFFNILDGENTWTALKHLTIAEKDNLKR